MDNKYYLIEKTNNPSTTEVIYLEHKITDIAISFEESSKVFFKDHITICMTPTGKYIAVIGNYRIPLTAKQTQDLFIQYSKHPTWQQTINSQVTNLIKRATQSGIKIGKGETKAGLRASDEQYLFRNLVEQIIRDDKLTT